MKNKKNKTSNELSISKNPEFFRLLLWHSVSITYPPHIFYRRVKALTNQDKKKINDLLDKWDDFMTKDFVYYLEEIDGVVAERAEKNDDPWK